MKFAIRGVLSCAMLLGLGIASTSTASAQCTLPYSGARPAGCPPAGYIFDLATVITGAMSPTVQSVSTSFVADNTSEFVSFAFREVPNYFAFDDACVALSTLTCLSGNLIADSDFSSATVGQNCGDGGNILGCP